MAFTIYKKKFPRSWAEIKLDREFKNYCSKIKTLNRKPKFQEFLSDNPHISSNPLYLKYIKKYLVCIKKNNNKKSHKTKISSPPTSTKNETKDMNTIQMELDIIKNKENQLLKEINNLKNKLIEKAVIRQSLSRINYLDAAKNLIYNHDLNHECYEP